MKLNAYLVLTWISWILNFAVFIKIMVRYGIPGEEDAEMLLFLIWLVFAICSVQWLTFAIRIKYGMPEQVGNLFFSAVMKFGDDHLQMPRDVIAGKYKIGEKINTMGNQKLSGYNNGIPSGNRI